MGNIALPGEDKEERRTDPFDRASTTWTELQAKYQDQYDFHQLQQYWNDTCTKDEDWDIALPKIPEEGKVDKEGKEDDECAKAKKDARDFLSGEGVKPKESAINRKILADEGAKAKRHCLIQVEGSKA